MTPAPPAERAFVSALKKASRVAFAPFRQAPVLSSTAVLSVGFSLAATAAYFAVLHGFVLSPLPFPDADRLIFVQIEDPRDRAVSPGGVHFSHIPLLEKHPAFLTGVAFLSSDRGTVVTSQGEPIDVPSMIVKGPLFDLLGVEPEIGRAFQPSDHHLNSAPVVILSWDIWVQETGGAPEALGSYIEIDGVHASIVGVMPPGFRFPYNVGMWRNWSALDPTAVVEGGCCALAFGSLARNGSLRAVRGWLEGVSSGADVRPPQVLSAGPLEELFLGPGLRTFVLLSGILFGLLLIVTFLNLSSFSISWIQDSEGAVAIKKALGEPDHIALIRYGIGVAGIVLPGALLGSLIGYWLTEIVAARVSAPFSGVAQVGFGTATTVFLLAATVVTSGAVLVVAGLRAREVEPQRVLQRRGTSFSHPVSATGVFFVSAQVAMASLLSIVAVGAVVGFQRGDFKTQGFDYSEVFVMELGEDPSRGPPEAITLPDHGSSHFQFGFVLPKETDRDRSEMIPVGFVGSGFFEVLSIKPIRGNLSSSSGDGGLVLTRSMALAEYGSIDVVGRTFRLDAGETRLNGTVRAIVEDIPLLPGLDRMGTLIVVGWHPTWSTRLLFRREVKESVSRAIVEVLGKEHLPETKSFAEGFTRQRHSERNAMMATVGFGATALILAMLGVASAFSHLLTNGRKALAVRVAVGGTHFQAVVAVLNPLTKPLGWAVGVGLGMALMLHSSLAHVVPSLQRASMGDAVLGLGCVALCVGLVVSRKTWSQRKTPIVEFLSEH